MVPSEWWLQTSCLPVNDHPGTRCHMSVMFLGEPPIVSKGAMQIPQSEVYFNTRYVKEIRDQISSTAIPHKRQVVIRCDFNLSTLLPFSVVPEVSKHASKLQTILSLPTEMPTLTKVLQNKPWPRDISSEFVLV